MSPRPDRSLQEVPINRAVLPFVLIARALIACILVAWVVAAAPARADIPMPNPVGWVQLPLQRTLMGNLLRNATRGQSHPVAGPPAPLPRPAGVPDLASPSGPTLRVGNDPAITARVLHDVVEQVRQRRGQPAADALQRFLAQTDIRADWVRMVAADGLQPDDLVDVITADWVLNWVLVNNGDNDRAQTLATRAQVARAVADVPGLARLDDAGRQAFADTLMLQQVVSGAAFLAAKRSGDGAAMMALSQGARAGFRDAFGLDLSAYQLTDSGLRPRR